MDVLVASRGGMALIIICTHIQQLFGFHNFDVAARITVILFFVMSGYSMAYSCANNIKNNGSFIWQDFLKKRFVKIIIPLTVVIIICAILSLIFFLFDFPRAIEKIDFTPKIGTQLLSIFSLGLYGTLNASMAFPFWFITALIRCYVVMGIISFIYFSASSRYIKGIISIFLIFYIFRSLRLHFDDTHKISINMYYMGYICFLCGALAFYSRRILLKLPIIATTFSIYSMICVLYSKGWINYNDDVMLIWQIVIGASFSILVPILSNLKIPNNKYISYLSEISYHLYIVHQPINIILGIILYKYLPAYAFNGFHIYILVISISIIAASCVSKLWTFIKNTNHKSYHSNNIIV